MPLGLVVSVLVLLFVLVCGRGQPSHKEIMGNFKKVIPIIPGLHLSLRNYARLATMNLWFPIHMHILISWFPPYTQLDLDILEMLRYCQVYRGLHGFLDVSPQPAGEGTFSITFYNSGELPNLLTKEIAEPLGTGKQQTVRQRRKNSLMIL